MWSPMDRVNEGLSRCYFLLCFRFYFYFFNPNSSFMELQGIMYSGISGADMVHPGRIFHNRVHTDVLILIITKVVSKLNFNHIVMYLNKSCLQVYTQNRWGRKIKGNASRVEKGWWEWRADRVLSAVASQLPVLPAAEALPGFQEVRVERKAFEWGV